MKISELIKKLESIKEDNGDLEVGIYKDDYSGQDGDYFSDIDLHKVESKDANLYEKYGDYKIKNVEKFVGIY